MKNKFNFNLKNSNKILYACLVLLYTDLTGCSKFTNTLNMRPGFLLDKKDGISRNKQFVEKEIEKKRNEYTNEFFPNDTVKTVETAKGSICDVDYYYRLFDKYSQEGEEIAIDLLHMHPKSPLNPEAILRFEDEKTSGLLPTLFIAICKNHRGICKFLLDKGAVINQHASIDDFDFYGNVTPLHLAVIRSRKEVVNLLLQNDKLDPNSQSSNGLWTPLLLAADSDDKDVVSLLLQHASINPNIQSGSAHTPLHHAVANHYIETVKLLLQHDKDKMYPINPNIQDRNRETPLHIACDWDYKEIVMLLLKHGQGKTYPIDRSIQDKNGKTALQVAESYKNAYVARLLKLHIA